MIEQRLSNKNVCATVSKSKKFLDLNKARVCIAAELGAVLGLV